MKIGAVAQYNEWMTIPILAYNIYKSWSLTQRGDGRVMVQCIQPYHSGFRANTWSRTSAALAKNRIYQFQEFVRRDNSQSSEQIAMFYFQRRSFNSHMEAWKLEHLYDCWVVHWNYHMDGRVKKSVDDGKALKLMSNQQHCQCPLSCYFDCPVDVLVVFSLISIDSIFSGWKRKYFYNGEYPHNGLRSRTPSSQTYFFLRSAKLCGPWINFISWNHFFKIWNRNLYYKTWFQFHPKLY